MNQIFVGDALEKLKMLPDSIAHCCVTSPPYWGLRDYGHGEQMGMERTPDEYVGKLVEIFNEVRRVLRKDGTLWLNLGDTYQNAKGQAGGRDPKQAARRHGVRPNDVSIAGLKPKDLVGIPWMTAFALRFDGWYLRQEVIWEKPNAMPDSVKDRPTRSHENLFLLSTSRHYFYDLAAVAEPSVRPGYKGNLGGAKGRAYTPEESDPNYRGGSEQWGNIIETGDTRNARSVWSIPTKPFKGAHFAAFPPELAERCIKAGCPHGGVVLDPFFGAGTTGMVAQRLGREFIGIELNPTYAEMARERIMADAPMFNVCEVIAA